jgi:hypothetical protein
MTGTTTLSKFSIWRRNCRLFRILQQSTKTGNQAEAEPALKRRMTINHDDTAKDISIFDITRGPGLAHASDIRSELTRLQSKPQTELHCSPTHQTMNFGRIWIRTTPSKKNSLATDTNWNDTFDRLKETAPSTTMGATFAASYTAETEEATAETTKLYWNETAEKL